jgi:hypothetical protein
MLQDIVRDVRLWAAPKSTGSSGLNVHSYEGQQASFRDMYRVEQTRDASTFDGI